MDGGCAEVSKMDGKCMDGSVSGWRHRGPEGWARERKEGRLIASV